MNNSHFLSEIQLEEIRKLAEKIRQSVGFVGDTPIANDIFTILDNEEILLLEYPIRSDGEKPAFSATLIYSKEGDKELAFIGLNTADYFDKQIFVIAHELYHYYTKTGSHLSRPSEEDNDLVEVSANRFAAEFLLPESTIKSIILEEFKMSSLEKMKIKALLRFIARLQCTWWLPYRSLVKRLRETSAISYEQYYELLAIDERDMDGEYGRIGRAINEESFLKLNKPTNNIGTSPKNIEIVIRNFEDELISVDKFTTTLALFNKNPDDFGYIFEVSDEDIAEFEDFFNEEVRDETSHVHIG